VVAATISLRPDDSGDFTVARVDRAQVDASRGPAVV